MKTPLTFLFLAGMSAYLYLNAPARSPVRTRRYSGETVFYLRQYVSIRTPHGYIGLLPGQEVSRAPDVPSQPGKVMVTTDGKDTLALDRAVLTHDMDEADALQAGDTQGQAMLAAELASTKQNADLRQQAEQAAMAEGINRASVLRASASAVGNHRTRLTEAAIWVGGGGESAGYDPVVVRESRKSETSAGGGTSGMAYGVILPQPARSTIVTAASARAKVNPGYSP